MSKLNNKLVALGSLSGKTYDDVAAACGEPRETVPCRFTDIGDGTRSTWSDGIFTVTMNFDKDGNYCGVHHHRNIGPYIWIAVISVVIVTTVLILGAHLRKAAAGTAGDAAGTSALLLENEAVWLHDSTAGICLLDLDFDGVPELLATDTDIVWYDELEAYYFGDSNVAVYSLANGAVTPIGGYVSDEYCFLATIHRFTDADGGTGWYYTSGGEVWLLTAQDGAVVAEAAATMPDISGGDEALPLLGNEAWVSKFGETPNAESVGADVGAICDAYFASR